MKSVLVDTSVWVAHFRQPDPHLITLLTQDRVMLHPLIVGEIACGTPPRRQQTLADLESLRPVKQASLREGLDFIEREQLYGLGVGLVDLLLLTSAMLTQQVELWTLDKRLAELALRFGLRHQPAVH